MGRTEFVLEIHFCIIKTLHRHWRIGYDSGATTFQWGNILTHYGLDSRKRQPAIPGYIRLTSLEVAYWRLDCTLKKSEHDPKVLRAILILSKWNVDKTLGETISLFYEVKAYKKDLPHKPGRKRLMSHFSWGKQVTKITKPLFLLVIW